MSKTRKDDALSIVGDEYTDDIEDLDEKQRTEKSAADDLVIKAEEKELTPNEEQELLYIQLLQRADYDDEAVEKATWDYAYKKSLPDSAYAWVETGSGCEKKDGKRPQKCRHLPYRDKSGNIDCGHVRAALQAIGGARTGKKMGAPASAKAKLQRALKACQRKKAEILETELDEYEQGRIDGYNAALDMLILDDEGRQMTEEKKETKTEAKAQEEKPSETPKEERADEKSGLDFDAIKAEMMPPEKPKEEPKEKPKEEKAEIDPIDYHIDLLKQVIFAEGHSRSEKFGTTEAIFRSLFAHVETAINESTPVAPEDIAKSLSEQVQEALKPLQDEIAVLKTIVSEGVKVPESPMSKAIKGVGYQLTFDAPSEKSEKPKESFYISPEETMRTARGGSESGGSLRRMVRDSVGLTDDASPL